MRNSCRPQAVSRYRLIWGSLLTGNRKATALAVSSTPLDFANIYLEIAFGTEPPIVPGEMTSVNTLAIVLTGTMLIYHQVTTWAPLFPWNDLERYSPKEIWIEAVFNGLLMGTALACLLSGNRGFTHWYPLAYFPFLLLGECVDWWIPYFSESFAKKRKIWDYEARFGRTTKLIPHRPGKRTPDANHVVLHLLTILAAMAVYFDRLGS